MPSLFQRARIKLSQGLFWFREKTGLGSWVIVMEDRVVTGQVSAISGSQLDGDFCFDILVKLNAEEATYHCEVMPEERWTGPRLDALCHRLRIGDQVKVRGRECFDPPHLGYPQELEIHPVSLLEKL